ncbi:MAG: F0F1 ATP synthase subunit A [Candidatus Carsonella ruddii]
MDILKNIYLSFKFVKKSLFININLIIISIFIKILILLLFFKKKILFIFIYFINNINKNINKNNRKIIFLISIIFFLNILLLNFMDLLPNIYLNFFLKLKKIKLTTTSNINYTFSFSIIFIILMIIISIKKNNLKNFIFFFFLNPIKNKFMIIFNFIIEFTSFLMKPISLSLRLFGNIFSSEIIFDLINKTNLITNLFLHFIWSIFHLLILPLQSFIFITLVIIYISQSLKH